VVPVGGTKRERINAGKDCLLKGKGNVPFLYGERILAFTHSRKGERGTLGTMFTNGGARDLRASGVGGGPSCDSLEDSPLIDNAKRNPTPAPYKEWGKDRGRNICQKKKRNLYEFLLREKKGFSDNNN